MRAASKASPSGSGGDEARAVYDALTDDLLYDPAIGGLVVKLPRERILQLVDDGTGESFAPAGKIFREWIAIPTVDRDQWHRLLDEAVDFARKGLAE